MQSRYPQNLLGITALLPSLLHAHVLLSRHSQCMWDERQVPTAHAAVLVPHARVQCMLSHVVRNADLDEFIIPRDASASTAAPEVLRSFIPSIIPGICHTVNGPAADIWSTGVMLYNMLTGEPDATSAATLQANMAVSEALALRGTPTFYWRKADGSEGHQEGLPTDIGAMIASIAPTGG